MDYSKLASEFLRQLSASRGHGPQKRISESMRGEAFALQFIAMREGEVIPSDISSEMGISSARVAAALNSLESKGLITRRIDVSDRRRILIELTQAGKEQAQEHGRKIFQMTKKIMEYLGEDDAREYIRIMGRLAEMPQGECE